MPRTSSSTAPTASAALSSTTALSSSVAPSHVAADPIAALLARRDVVRDGGRYAVQGIAVTRETAMREDLLRVRRALDDAGLDYLLIRGDDDRPVLAMDRLGREHIEAAFATAFAAEPFYARVASDDKRAERLLALGRLPGEDADTYLIYRRRVRSARAAWRPSEAATLLELWSFGQDEMLAPRPNALTRRRISRADAVMTSVELYGERWPTLAGMFDDHADAVDFPIDMVFTWVDGDEPAYLAARAARLQQTGGVDHAPARYRQIGELRYALRSVKAFAPWVRRIFIVTDSTPPAWLDTEHPDVRIVRSEQFFSDPSALPTFNSHAIEAQLHRIPDLSEHFLYSNDDMFFGRPVTPAMFFTPGGISRFVEATTRIGIGDSSPDRSGHDNAMRVNRALLRQRFGRTITRHLEHCAAPLRKSVLAEIEQQFAADFARTVASPFRSPTDISVTNSLYHYYALFTGRAVTQTALRTQYIETTLLGARKRLRALERRRSVQMFCLNDGTEPQLDENERVALVTGFLERYFPVPGPWEKTA